MTVFRNFNKSSNQHLYIITVQIQLSIMFIVTDQMNYAEKKLMALALLRPTELESLRLEPSPSEEGVISNQYAQGELCRSKESELSLTGRP